MTASTPNLYNEIKKQVNYTLLKDLSPSKIKTVVGNFFRKSY